MLRSDSLKRKTILAWQLLKGEAERVVPAKVSVQESTFTALEKTAKPKSCPRNNRSHISITDAEAKLTQKAGKPSRLYYLSSMSVDTYRHVITHIQADGASCSNGRRTRF